MLYDTHVTEVSERQGPNTCSFLLPAATYGQCREAAARSFSEVSSDKGRGNRGMPEHKQFQLDLKKKKKFLQKERSNTGTVLIILSLVIFEGPRGKEA